MSLRVPNMWGKVSGKEGAAWQGCVCVWLCAYVCVCVCVRERERERLS